MKLWLLRPHPVVPTPNPWKPWFDKAFGFVIRAKTESEARAFAAMNAGDENPSYRTTEGSPWLDDKFSLCEALTARLGDPGVVIQDFHSA